VSTDTIAKEPLVDALSGVWSSIDELLGSLDEAQWDTPTSLPGWTVRDVAAHLIGTESMLAGEEAPGGEADADAERPPHVKNDIGAFNERWVEGLRDQAPAAVLERFRRITSARLEALRSMSQADFDAPSWTPVGQATYGRFMQIRVFDCWLHEQDIRDAVARPGHDSGPCAEQSIDEVARALGFLVGKRAGAPAGSRVTVELTGPAPRTLHVAVDERAAVVPSLDRPATATVRMPAGLFIRLAGGRVDPADHLAEVELEGDTDLARRIATSLAFTI
jgi:uncharacterized protein (TIGR03083 family)